MQKNWWQTNLSSTIGVTFLGTTTMQKSFIALLGAFVMALTGCTEKDPADNLTGQAAKNLQGTSWQLVTAEPPAKGEENCENLPPVMDFLDKNRVSGNLGCNLFNTTYTQDGKSFSFAPAATTRRMCSPEAMKMEGNLLNMLQNTRYLTQNEKGLMFWDEKGKLLAQYEPEKAGQCQ